MAAPTITLIAPSTAPPGATVQIIGSGFTGATAVKFGSTNATSFTVIADT
ncbi:IPT/TIG domain-containing protein, partial [Streptomyces javensis]